MNQLKQSKYPEKDLYRVYATLLKSNYILKLEFHAKIFEQEKHLVTVQR